MRPGLKKLSKIKKLGVEGGGPKKKKIFFYFYDPPPPNLFFINALKN